MGWGILGLRRLEMGPCTRAPMNHPCAVRMAGSRRKRVSGKCSPNEPRSAEAPVGTGYPERGRCGLELIPVENRLSHQQSSVD
jgi:hypothetical protein